MKFIIKNKNGKGVFSTEHESCVPVTKLDSMNAAGLTFWLDGKKISVSSAKNQFKDIPTLVVYKQENGPVEESDVTIHKYGDKEKDFFPTTVYETISHGNFSENKEISEAEEASISVVEVVKKETKPEEFKLDLSAIDFPINSRCIVCLNNGRIYKTQTEAGKELKLDPATISTAISAGKPYKGYTFKKVMELMQ